MAQINAPRPLTSPEKRAEERQDSFQTSVARGRSFVEDNRALVIGVVAGVLAIVLGGLAWGYLSSQRNAEAEEQLGSILSFYETGDLETALNGTDESPGLLEIADQYGGKTAAPFFAADALFQLGRYDEAETFFRKVDLGGLFGASATAGLAAVNEMQGDYAEAGELYERAASDFAGEATAPGYLLDAGRAFEAAGQMDAAERAYQRVLDEFEDSPEATTAAVELASVQAAQNAFGDATGDVEPAPAQDSTASAAPAVAPEMDDAALQQALQDALAGQ
ncbi:MAG: tetratricopeptide repeat protein [Bacteroidota bacterium]